MGDDKLDLLQGTLDLMVLRTLGTLGPMHGYGLARRIERVSGNALLLNQGTIYAALVRLQQRGWITAEWALRRQPEGEVLLAHQTRAARARGRDGLVDPAGRRDVSHSGRLDGATVMALDELRRALTRASVTARTREIGIRMALGAAPRTVHGQMLGEAAVLALLGVAVGVVGALGVSRIVSSLAFGVSALDPMAFAAAPLALLLVSVVAALVPALRAARTSPVTALRAE